MYLIKFYNQQIEEKNKLNLNLDHGEQEFNKQNAQQINNLSYDELKFPVNNNNNNNYKNNNQKNHKINNKNKNNFKKIIVYAFEQSFSLNLNIIRNNAFLLSSSIYDKSTRISTTSSRSSTSSSSNYSINNFNNNDCFYTGYIDDDLSSSSAYINLCHQGHIVSFLFYF